MTKSKNTRLNWLQLNHLARKIRANRYIRKLMSRTKKLYKNAKKETNFGKIQKLSLKKCKRVGQCMKR